MLGSPLNVLMIGAEFITKYYTSGRLHYIYLIVGCSPINILWSGKPSLNVLVRDIARRGKHFEGEGTKVVGYSSAKL